MQTPLFFCCCSIANDRYFCCCCRRSFVRSLCLFVPIRYTKKKLECTTIWPLCIGTDTYKTHFNACQFQCLYFFFSTCVFAHAKLQCWCRKKITSTFALTLNARNIWPFSLQVLNKFSVTWRGIWCACVCGCAKRNGWFYNISLCSFEQCKFANRRKYFNIRKENGRFVLNIFTCIYSICN